MWLPGHTYLYWHMFRVIIFSSQFGFVWKRVPQTSHSLSLLLPQRWPFENIPVYNLFRHTYMHACSYTHTFCLRSTDLHVSIIFLAASCSPGAVGSRPTGSSHPARELRGRDGRRHCLNWYVSSSQRVIDGFVWFCMYIYIFLCLFILFFIFITVFMDIHKFYIYIYIYVKKYIDLYINI